MPGDDDQQLQEIGSQEADPAMSRQIRSRLTRMINEASAICSYAASLETWIVSQATYRLDPSRSDAALRSIKPLAKLELRIQGKIAEWNSTIDGVADLVRRQKEKEYQSAYFETVLSSYILHRTDPCGEEPADPLESFLEDVEFYLDRLRLHVSNNPDSIGSLSGAASLHEDEDVTRSTTSPSILPASHMEPRHSQNPQIPAALSAVRQAEENVMQNTRNLPIDEEEEDKDRKERRKDHLTTVEHLIGVTSHSSLPRAHPNGNDRGAISQSRSGRRMERRDEIRRDDTEKGDSRGQPMDEDQQHLQHVTREGSKIYRPPLYTQPQAAFHMAPHMAYPVAPPSLQLPSMPLPNFDGSEPWTFPTFLTTFEAVVHPTSLTELQQLHYLRCCLSGEANDAVASILPREGCYASAIERLNTIYKGDPQQMSALIRQRIQEIEKLPEDCGMGMELKAVRDSRTLVEQLGVGEPDSLFLTDTIVSKLPRRVVKKAIKMRMEHPSIGTIPLLEKLETTLIKDITVEKLTHTSKKEDKEEKENVRVTVMGIEEIDEEDQKKEEKSDSKLMSPLTNPPPTSFIDGKGCAMCNKHPAGQEERCKLFATPDERISRCRMRKLCFRCLKGTATHNFRNCDTVCSYCNGRHHRALCKRAFAPKNVQICQDGGDIPTDEYYDEMEKEIDGVRGENALPIGDLIGAAAITPPPFLPRIPSSKLMTFLGLIVNPVDGKTYPVNVMLDPGASVSLISNRLVGSLGMQVLGVAETAFAGVGGVTSEYKHHRVFSFHVTSTMKDSASVEVVAYEMQAPLTGPERQFELSSKDRQFIRKERLESALLEDPNGVPDILLGQDPSSECMNTGLKYICLPSGMKLIPTSLGYVRTGYIKKERKDMVHCLGALPLENVRTLTDLQDDIENKRRRTSKTIEGYTTDMFGVQEEALHQEETQKDEEGKKKGSQISPNLPRRLFSTFCRLPFSSLIFLYIVSMVFLTAAATDLTQSIDCLPHGATVNSTAGYGLQICSPTNCLLIPPQDNHGSVSVDFPPSMSASSFSVFTKMVTEENTFTSRRTCPASDVCFNMRHDWSLDHFVHPHCYPWTTLFMLAAMVYAVAILMALLVYMVFFRPVTGAEILMSIWRCHRLGCSGAFYIYRLIRMSIKGLRTLVMYPFGRLLRRPRSARDDEWRRNEMREARMNATRRTTQAVLGMAIVVMLISPTPVRACHHAVMTTEEVERCQEDKCHNEKGIEISTDSVSRTACIKLTKDGKEKVEGMITIEVLDNQLICTRRTNGLHREAEVHVSSSKRCFASGSCDGQTCENLKASTEIEEFDHLLQFPGHTRCMESGGGWENGCLSFHTACLFFKTYLQTTSAKIFESIRCTSWINRVLVRVNSTMGSITSSTNVTMREGEFTSKMSDIGLRMFRVDEIETSESVDILHEIFLTDGMRMAATRNFVANNVCPNKEAAKDFRCVPKEKCVCQPVTSKVNCECEDFSIEKRFTLESTLPIRLTSMDIAMDTETLSPIVHRKRGSIKFYLVLNEKMHSVLKEESTDCKVVAGQAKGCYLCEEGAEVEFTCYSPMSTNVLVSCEGNALSLPCGPEVTRIKTKLFFDRSEVAARCQSSCNAKEIEVKGTLSAPPHLLPSAAINRVKNGEVPRWEFLPDLEPLLNLILEHWKSSIILSIATLMAIFVTFSMVIGGRCHWWLLFPRICNRSEEKRRLYKDV